MSALTRFRGDDRGLTLIETLAALTVFAIITLGLTPLLASSMRGAGVSRSYTVGKNLASQAMERIRGLPYFESVQGQVTPTRRDILDLYFPDRGAGFNSGTNTFTTTCTATSKTPAASAPLACPRELPANYEVEFVARFVEPGTGTPQDFTTEPPSTTPAYNWSTTATEAPPTQLLEMTVTSRWTYGGVAKSFSLSSLFGQRHLSQEQIRGTGRVYYAVQVLSALQDPNGQPVSVVSTAGSSESNVATRTVAAADQQTRSAYVTVTEEEFNGAPATTVVNESGASRFLHAPPDSYLAPDVTVGEKSIGYTFSDGTTFPVAFMDSTRSQANGVRVVNELPESTGGFRFSGGTGDESLWVDNQANRDPTTPLQLHPASPMFFLEKDGSSRLTGASSAVTTALTPTSFRKVETTAEASFGQLNLIPTSFITDLEASVVVIEDFTATISCKSTADPFTSSVTGEWSATLRFWMDNDPDDLLPLGHYETRDLGGVIGSADPDPFVDLRAQNPLVYDDVVDARDVYLFEETDGDGNITRNGYLREAASTTAPESFDDPAGRETRVTLDGAIRIDTAPTDAGVEATAMSISIGKLSCEAVDKRGL